MLNILRRAAVMGQIPLALQSLLKRLQDINCVMAFMPNYANGEKNNGGTSYKYVGKTDTLIDLGDTYVYSETEDIVIEFEVRGSSAQDSRVYFEGSRTEGNPFYGIGVSNDGAQLTRLRVFIRKLDGGILANVTIPLTVFEDGKIHKCIYEDIGGSIALTVDGVKHNSVSYTRPSEAEMGITSSSIGGAKGLSSFSFFTGALNNLTRNGEEFTFHADGIRCSGPTVPVIDGDDGERIKARDLNDPFNDEIANYMSPGHGDLLGFAETEASGYKGELIPGGLEKTTFDITNLMGPLPWTTGSWSVYYTTGAIDGEGNYEATFNRDDADWTQGYFIPATNIQMVPNKRVYGRCSMKSNCPTVSKFLLGYQSGAGGYNTTLGSVLNPPVNEWVTISGLVENASDLSAENCFTMYTKFNSSANAAIGDNFVIRNDAVFVILEDDPSLMAIEGLLGRDLTKEDLDELIVWGEGTYSIDATVEAMLKLDGVDDQVWIEDVDTFDPTGAQDFAVINVFKTDAVITTGYVFAKNDLVYDDMQIGLYTHATNDAMWYRVAQSVSREHAGVLEPNSIYVALLKRIGGRLKLALNRASLSDIADSTTMLSSGRFKIGARSSDAAGTPSSPSDCLYGPQFFMYNGDTGLNEANIDTFYDEMCDKYIGAVVYAQMVYDAFTRVDSATLGNAQTGQTWEVIDGDAEISGGKAASTVSSGFTKAVIETDKSDVKVQATLSRSSGSPRLIARVVDSGNLIGLTMTSPTTLTLYKRVAGGYVWLKTITVTNAPNMRCSLECVGDQVKIYYFDTLMATETITDHQTATKHGFSIYNDVGARVDNFSIEDLS